MQAVRFPGDVHDLDVAEPVLEGGERRPLTFDRLDEIADPTAWPSSSSTRTSA
jgi:hypothetical protein